MSTVPIDVARTDIALAKKFVELHGARFSWVDEWDDWLWFDDLGFRPRPVGNPILNPYPADRPRAHAWVRDEELTAELAAQDVCRTLMAEAHENPLPDAALQRKALEHARGAGMLPKIRAILALAKPLLAREAAEFNTNPWLFACANGVVDLRTGELRDGKPEDLITRATRVKFDPAATCPTFDTFISEIMCGAEEMMAYLWRVIGYALTGVGDERAFFIFHGDGRNGKSTLVETLMKMYGSGGRGYAQKARFSTFLAKPVSGGANDDVAHLEGARAVFAVEASGNEALDVALIKELTGGDTVRARYLYQGEFEFRTAPKIFLVTNKIPPIHEETHALWDRLHYVAFELRVPEEKVDRKLGDKLAAELPGILARAVRECVAWQNETTGGLKPPEKILLARKELYEENDLCGEFLTEACEFAKAFSALHGDTYTAFRSWCAGRGINRPPSSKWLRKQLERKAKDKASKVTWPDKREVHHSPLWGGFKLRSLYEDRDDL